MSDSSETFGSGILRGLKRVLFQPDPSGETPVVNEPRPQAPPGPALAGSSNAMVAVDEGSFRDMKLRVYQLLENMNKPGVDFFEVWNAAIEMGGPNTANIRSAFTSLRFADKSLTKAKLLETGASYIAGLQQVIDSESQKRSEEKVSLEQERQRVGDSLDTEIVALEQQIETLQATLLRKKTERQSLDQNYAPRLAGIEDKINLGRTSVRSVLDEMQQVLDIINKDLN